MRSPEPPSLLRWALRPRPTGTNRYAAAYLAALSGTAVATLTLAIAATASRSCRTDGFGCLSGYFQGIALAVVFGLTVILGVSIFLKLGLAYALTVIALLPVVVLIGVLLNGTLLGVPAMIIFGAAVPAAASRISARLC